MEGVTLLSDYYGLILGFISLVIVLAKMHANIETLNEKVKVVFSILNSRRKD